VFVDAAGDANEGADEDVAEYAAFDIGAAFDVRKPRVGCNDAFAFVTLPPEAEAPGAIVVNAGFAFELNVENPIDVAVAGVEANPIPGRIVDVLWDVVATTRLCTGVGVPPKNESTYLCPTGVLLLL